MLYRYDSGYAYLNSYRCWLRIICLSLSQTKQKYSLFPPHPFHSALIHPGLMASKFLIFSVFSGRTVTGVSSSLCNHNFCVLGQCGYSAFIWVGWGVWVIKLPTQNLSQVNFRQYSQSKEEKKYLLSLPLWGRVYCDLYIFVLNVRHCAGCLSCTPSISWRFPYQNLPPLCFSGRGKITFTHGVDILPLNYPPGH